MSLFNSWCKNKRVVFPDSPSVASRERSRVDSSNTFLSRTFFTCLYTTSIKTWLSRFMRSDSIAGICDWRYHRSSEPRRMWECRELEKQTPSTSYFRSIREESSLLSSSSFASRPLFSCSCPRRCLSSICLSVCHIYVAFSLFLILLPLMFLGLYYCILALLGDCS